MPGPLADTWRQHMRRGDFEAAWRISDRALEKRARHVRAGSYQEATWRGEALGGKRVIVRCCYGLGDTLQFVRYVPLLRRLARSVIVQAQAPIMRVLEYVGGIDVLITRYNAVSPGSYEVAIDLTELPHVFRTSLETIPPPIRCTNMVPRMCERTGNVRVGLFWEGSDRD